MKIIISPEIFKNFPKLHVGIVFVKGINNSGVNEKIHTMLKEIIDYIKINIEPDNISGHKSIKAWREAYSSFGAKPSKYNSSVESLLKRVLKDGSLPKINKFVDVYNMLSLKHMVPMGADDINKVEGDIHLKYAKGNEIFIPLNSTEVDHPNEGEVVYTDDRTVLCRRWNWKDGDKSKITDQTVNAILYIEGIPPVEKSQIENACQEAANLFEMFCGGKASYHVLDIGNSELEL